ncbi:MAG: 50S ribosomal protein L10 [Clostridiales bacterium]|nr:50S ribosomal protein L10 [Clostridiales bacterium]
MPNAKVLSEKQAVVAELVERIKGSGSGVFVDYKGITVAEDTALRTELRKSDVNYSVIKNTLCRRAINELGLSELDSVLNGTTSLATADGDPIAPFRVISDYAKKFGDSKFNIKAGIMDGRVLSMDEIKEISALPSKDALYAKVLGTMLAPITSLAVVLGQIVEKGGGSIEAADSAAEEAPAAEASAAETEEAPAEAPAAE